MAKLEDLKRGATVKGVLPDCPVTVVDVRWYGSAAIELTYKDPAGKPNVELLYRDREPTMEVVKAELELERQIQFLLTQLRDAGLTDVSGERRWARWRTASPNVPGRGPRGG